MEKNRLIKFSIRLCQIYLIAVLIWFFLAMIASYFWYFEDGSITDFCIPVSVDSGHYYHFRVSEHNACLIDWLPFLNEAIFVPIEMLLILTGPVLLLWLFLRRQKVVFQK